MLMKNPNLKTLLITSACTALACVPMITQAAPAGLVAYWNANSNAVDSVGAHNGTLMGNVTYGEGHEGQAFDFTPTSRVNIPDNAAFQTPSFTLSGWVNPDVWGGILMYRGDGRGGMDTYTLSLYTAGELTFWFCTTNNQAVTISAPLQLSRWSHFAATFDDATGAMKLYVDGQLKSNIVTTLRPIVYLNAGASVAIGNVEPGNDFSFNGRADDIGIYSRALSADEVMEIYAPNPVSYWSADGNALDSVSGHNGTVYGDVTYTNGIFGQAFNIVPGWTGSRVRIEDSPDYATPSFTISGWANVRSFVNHLLVRGDSRGGMDTYVLSAAESGKLTFSFSTTNNSSMVLKGPLQQNRWTHFAATFNDATGTMKLYINGVLQSETNTTLRPIINLNASLSPGIGLGNVPETSNNFNMDGLLDEISIYSRAITAEEIKSMFDAADTDRDGLIDLDETAIYHTDPNKADTDGDGLSDGSEVKLYLTNPMSSDTDGDGYGDYAEIYAGKKPNDASDHPAAALSLFTAVELEFIGKTNTTYYIQSSPDMTTWTNYDGPILGNGGIWKKLYSTRDAAKQYFRVEAAQ